MNEDRQIPQYMPFKEGEVSRNSSLKNLAEIPSVRLKDHSEHAM
jgi:hypothetical protein